MAEGDDDYALPVMTVLSSDNYLIHMQNPMSKKRLILKAFEELDADMLEVLLNDTQSYQDVHKETFVAEIKQYFLYLRKNCHNELDFKAVQGICTKCSYGKKGYSFVNSEGESFMSMVFEESDDDYSDIYKCSSFKTFDKEIKEEWAGIHFYDDDQVDYIPTEFNIREKNECDRAVKAIEMEIEKEGMVSKHFYVPWINSYGHLHTIEEAFFGQSYRYKNNVTRYIGVFDHRVIPIRNCDLAKQFWKEFISFPVITREVIQDWLIRCDYDFPYHKYGFEYECDFRHGYFIDTGVKVNLPEYYYLQNIAVILHRYLDWIPEENPLKKNEGLSIDGEDEDQVPF
ncbi:hypothetical protein EGI11_03475 [Chryseobacterium sp. H3056]|uniref:Uncharacterized protein n=2 Tax=Kaistella daneshvariae TaxID=2487074 RepID=A0A3N0X0L1_9FLAO|nr:hypothetical protein EGI11_03475 [Kaistella daneshvariae]